MKKKILTKPFAYVSIGSKNYIVDVAMDDESRYKGLSRRHNIEDGYGMLFEMPKEDIHPFQMKDTYIPLDMVFIGKYGQIVDYIPNVQPLTDGPYKPKNPCKFVLEVPGNDLIDKIKEGDLTRMKFFDTMESARAHYEKKNLQELLIKYFNEEFNGKSLRGKQTITGKNSDRSRKTI